MEEKLDKLDNHMEAIKHLLTNLNNTLEDTTKKIETMERKIDNLCEKIDGEVLEECKKIGYLTGPSEERYTLTDLNNGDDQIETDEEN